MHTTPFGAEMSAVGCAASLGGMRRMPRRPLSDYSACTSSIKRVHLKYDHHPNTMMPMAGYDSFVRSSEARKR